MVNLSGVTAVLNKAADDVLDAIDAGDTGARDIVNLLVNVAIERLTHDRDLTVEQVIEVNYEASVDDVLGWCEVEPLVT